MTKNTNKQKKLDDPLHEKNPKLQGLQSKNLKNTEKPPQLDFQNKRKKDIEENAKVENPYFLQTLTLAS
jgi:hypothetical protein